MEFYPRSYGVQWGGMSAKVVRRADESYERGEAEFDDDDDDEDDDDDDDDGSIDHWVNEVDAYVEEEEAAAAKGEESRGRARVRASKRRESWEMQKRWARISGRLHLPMKGQRSLHPADDEHANEARDVTRNLRLSIDTPHSIPVNTKKITLGSKVKTIFFTFDRVMKRVVLGYHHHSTTPPPPSSSLNPVFSFLPFLSGHLHTLRTVLPWQSEPPTTFYYGRRVFEQLDPRFKGTFAVDFVIDQDKFFSHDSGEKRVSGDGRKKDDGKTDRQGTLLLPSRTRCLTTAECRRMDEKSDSNNDDRPMLVVLHGLSGGSHELYLRYTIGKILASSSSSSSPPPPSPADPERMTDGDEQQSKWEICVINSRGCAESPVTTSVLYNARATWDLRQAVEWLRQRFPRRPLFALGFSLGANILTNYLGEEGEACHFKAAMLISNPWNLEVGSLALQRSWMGLHGYSRAMGASLRKLVEKNEEQISKNFRIDVNRIRRRCKFLHEFDRAVQCPSWGYPTEGAYYRDASSTDAIAAIKIPFLALHATDDPIAVDEALPRQEFEQTQYGVLCTTSIGGHLGWFQFGGDRWFANVVSRSMDHLILFCPSLTLFSAAARLLLTRHLFRRRDISIPWHSTSTITNHCKSDLL